MLFSGIAAEVRKPSVYPEVRMIPPLRYRKVFTAGMGFGEIAVTRTLSPAWSELRRTAPYPRPC